MMHRAMLCLSLGRWGGRQLILAVGRRPLLPGTRLSAAPAMVPVRTHVPGSCRGYRLPSDGPSEAETESSLRVDTSA